MAKIFVDLTEDERHWNGQIDVRFEDSDGLRGNENALCIGNEIEIVLSTPQAITLFDVLDGWLNGGPAKAIGDFERRIMASIKSTVEEHGSAIRAMNTRPEELARCLYDAMKAHGIRFRFNSDEPLIRR
jgi:hypothetical protein